MMPEIEAARKNICPDTFGETKVWLRKMRDYNGYECMYDIEYIPPSYYILTWRGEVVGRGLSHYEAVKDAEMHMASLVHSRFKITCRVGA